MNTLRLLVVVATILSRSVAFAEEPDTSFNVWRMLTDSKYRAARSKQYEKTTLRVIPIQGRLAACNLAEEIVSSPLEWQDNSRRIAEIPAVLQMCGVEFTDDFKVFQASATALIEFSAQLQSITREQVSRQLATEREHASHSISIEANLEPKLLARYSGLLDSERQASSEKTTIEKKDFPALTTERAATFRSLYAQLLSDYSTVIKRMPSITELIQARSPTN